MNTNPAWDTSQILGDIRYIKRVARLHARLYGRLSFLATLIQLFAGTALFSSVVSQLNTQWEAALSLLIVGVGILQSIYPLGQLVERCNVCNRDANELEYQLSQLSELEATQRLSKLQSVDVNPLTALETMAYNFVCDLHNAPTDKIREGLAVKFFRLWI